MRKIVSVDIVLENCEVVNAPLECIKQFLVSRTYTNYRYLDYCDGSIEESVIISKGELVLKNLDKLIYNCTWEDNIYTALERIGNDITQLHFKYDDDTQKSFYVHWYGDNSNYSEGINTYIKKSFCNDNELHIKIFNPSFKNNNNK